MDHVSWWSQTSPWTDDGHVPSEQEELTATGVSHPKVLLVNQEQDSLLIGWLWRWLWLTCSEHHYARKHTELSSWLQQLPITVTCQWHWFCSTHFYKYLAKVRSWLNWNLLFVHNISFAVIWNWTKMIM